jgi:uncharacterized membrane protein YecN with MAPEG domain
LQSLIYERKIFAKYFSQFNPSKKYMTTSLYTALLALILIFLSIKIIQNRRSAKISLGENGDDFLHRKIRAHGNFIEYTPIFLIMLILVEINGLDKYFIHFFGIIFISGRALHAYGIMVAEVRAKNFLFRQAGMFCTFFLLE